MIHSRTGRLFAFLCCQWTRAASAASLSRRASLVPSPRRTLQHYSTSQPLGSALGKDKPKPFLNTEAHRRTVEDSYVLTEEEQRRGRYGVPLGLSLFAFIMYFAFIREYSDRDKAVIDFLTKDISDKVPPHKMARIKQQLKEEEEMLKKLTVAPSESTDKPKE